MRSWTWWWWAAKGNGNGNPIREECLFSFCEPVKGNSRKRGDVEELVFNYLSYIFSSFIFLSKKKKKGDFHWRFFRGPQSSLPVGVHSKTLGGCPKLGIVPHPTCALLLYTHIVPLRGSTSLLLFGAPELPVFLRLCFGAVMKWNGTKILRQRLSDLTRTGGHHASWRPETDSLSFLWHSTGQSKWWGQLRFKGLGDWFQLLLEELLVTLQTAEVHSYSH